MRGRVLIAGMAVVAVLLGVAPLAGAAAPLAYDQVAFTPGAASLSGSDWTASGPAGCTVQRTVTLTGTAALQQGAGGEAELVLQMTAGRRPVTITGSVVVAGPSELQLDMVTESQSAYDTGTLLGDATTFTGVIHVATPQGCRLTATGTLTLPGSGLTESVATSSTRVDLGGVSVDGYCEATYHQTAELPKGSTGPDVAFDNWSCGTGGPIVSLQAICESTYDAQATGVTAVATDPNNALSWQCFGTPLAAGTTTTTAPVPTTTLVAGGTTGGSSSGAVAPIAGTLATPGEVFHSIGHDLLAAVITVAAMLFIAFPANIFNQTFQDHYEEILGMLATARRRVREALGLGPDGEASPPPSSPADEPAPAKGAPRASTPAWFVATLVAGAVLGGLLNPAFGANASTVEDLAAALLAFGFGAVVSWFVARAFRRHHHYEHHTYLRALPLGLGIAAACVLVSRITDFQPGYLYGVVVGLAFVEGVSDRHNAHLTALSSLSTLAVAIAAWLLWIPLNHLALEPGSSPFLVVLDDTAASIFVAGLVGTVVSMLPLRGLPGGTLVGWRRDAWAAVCFLALFLLVEVELFPASGPAHPGGAPILTAAVLFVAFGALSFGFRAHFERRAREAAPVPAPEAATD